MFNKYPSDFGKTSTLRHLGRGALGAIVAIGLLAGTHTTAQAQTPAQQFADADWFERELGAGVIWRSHMFESLFAGRQHISYIEIDLNNPAVEIIVPHLPTSTQRTTLMTPAQFPNALASVNGTYYTSGGHNTYLRVDGTVIPHQTRSKGLWGHHAGFILDDQGDWGIAYIPGTNADDWALDTTSDTIMANGPMLLLNSNIESASMALPSGTHCTAPRSRTIVGLTNDNRAILLTVDEGNQRSTGVTCEQMAELLLLLDIVDAVNLDGGGSTTMWVAGEPNNGLANYLPAAGERSVANALGVTSSAPAAPVQWDARLVSMSYNKIVEPEETQNVTVIYQNLGTETWTQADTRFITARPAERPSDLYDSGAWVSNSQPALMSPASVGPGENATFTFPVTPPASTTAVVYEEFFMLEQGAGVGRIGPGDERALLNLTAIPGEPTGPTTIVESRSGGQNFNWYLENGAFSDSSPTSAAPGITPNVGSRWTSTYISVIGLREAIWRPDFDTAGEYAVHVTWAEGGTLRRNPVVYHVDHADGRTSVDIDQSAPGGLWYPLGVFTFNEGRATNGQVIMSNVNTDVSGNMWASAARFVLLESETSVDEWSLY